MVDRVRRPQKHDGTLLALKDSGIFSSYKDALVFSAALGYSRSKRVSFDKTSEPVSLSIFRGDFDEALINCLALAEKDDATFLASEGDKFDEKIRLFEEYACGGLGIINNSIIEPGLDLQNEIIRLILDEEIQHNIIDDITSLG
jgi:dnd system-associated protein 4